MKHKIYLDAVTRDFLIKVIGDHLRLFSREWFVEKEGQKYMIPNRAEFLKKLGIRDEYDRPIRVR